MHPHSYTVDSLSLSQSQDLESSILSSNSPAQISAAAAAVDSFLHSHSPDQSRHFFSFTFPTLICKIFGFDDATSLPPAEAPQSNGWIDTVLASNDPDSAANVFGLLSPDGVLLSSIAAVDRLELVKYVFPNERLPEWMRFMLLNDKDCGVLSDLCPWLKGKLKEDSIKGSSFQIQLNVFEYYMFWFAYYPVCKANCDNLNTNLIKKSPKFKLGHWTSSIRGFSNPKRGPEQKIECNLYMRLLYAYLRAFVPIQDLNSHQPYRSSLLHYSIGYENSVIKQVEFLVNTLIQFWLVDNDFSPLPVNVCKSWGVSFPFRSVLGEAPASSGLGEVMKMFVKYLSLSSVTVSEESENVEYHGSPRWRALGSHDSAKSRDVRPMLQNVPSVGSWNLLIQRPLYRFILRTFLFCPMGASMKNVMQVFSVWVSYMKPWAISLEDFAEIVGIVDGYGTNVRKENGPSQERGYSSLWQGYVLSNYLYYSSLVMHFIGFAHKFLHADPEIIVQMVLKVLHVLTSSKELVDLIKNVDTFFHSKQAGSGKSMLNSLYTCVPSIREQLQDWEDGLCESDADGSFLHDNWNKDLRLFSDGEDGGHQLLQLFILRAEAELQAISGDNLAHNLQCVDSLKGEISCLFGGHTLKPMSVSPEPRLLRQSRNDVFKPRRVGNHSFSDIKYKGDWMKRPISDDEVAWLAKLLVWFSGWLNESLSLNQAESNEVGPTWSYVEVSGDAANVYGPTETAKMVLFAIGSWLLMLSSAVVKLMRKHGLRVNLRVLASKKVVVVLLVSAVFSLLKRTFGLLCR